MAESKREQAQKNIYTRNKPVAGRIPRKDSDTGSSRPVSDSAGEYLPVQPPRLKKKVSVDHHDLPALDSNTSITLMPRDPHWIHAYWNVSERFLTEAKRRLGEDVFNRSTQTIRMYDVTYKDFEKGDAPNRIFDIDVGAFTKNWYIDLWSDHAAYCADLGLRTPEGDFLPLARSNFVATPRQASSGRQDAIWMEVKGDMNQRPFVQLDEAQKRVHRNVAAHGKKFGNRIFLTEDDIRAYYSRLFPLLKKIVSLRLARDDQKHRISLKDGHVVLDDLLIQGISKSEFLRRILLGASAEMIEKGGASEQISSGASYQAHSERTFFFEIGTELIVYGRTEPGAIVLLGGKNVALRPDGTFTLRFGLPDAGYIPLDFVAQSRDTKERRTITTSVRRNKTQYSR